MLKQKLQMVIDRSQKQNVTQRHLTCFLIPLSKNACLGQKPDCLVYSMINFDCFTLHYGRFRLIEYSVPAY